jgi:hypothetical protein
MPRVISSHVGDFAARGGMAGIIAKLWRVIRIEIPIGYQDETGFHIGVKSFDLFFRPACHSFPVRNRRRWLHKSRQN